MFTNLLLSATLASLAYALSDSEHISCLSENVHGSLDYQYLRYVAHYNKDY